jgi:hypothetical protein
MPELTSGSELILSKSFILAEDSPAFLVAIHISVQQKGPLPFEQGPPHSLERLRYSDNSQIAIKFHRFQGEAAGSNTAVAAFLEKASRASDWGRLIPSTRGWKASGDVLP